MQTQTKRATVYLDPEIHRALKIKAAETDSTLSNLINAAIHRLLEEDHEDLVAFDDRKNEPNLDFQDVLKELKPSGAL